ncbi:MAG TPA: NHL repeat-containing protein, partial [Solirubrobacterales bacterium]|nr:NHL repeat-containing protein [Solirubrobacterales bacterium]
MPAPSQAAIEAIELEEEERVEWLAGPEAKSQREASLDAYTDLTASEARELLTEAFPGSLGQLNEDPGRVLSELEIEESLGTYGALVSDGGGETSIVESTVPVESDLGGDGEQPVDLSLESSGEGFVPQNPLVETELPDSAEDPVRLQGGLEIQLPASDDHAASALGDKNLFYPETAVDTDTLVSPLAGGVEVFEQLRSPASPQQFSFTLGVPEGASVQATEFGGAEVTSGPEDVVAQIPPPTAVDAQGVEVPVTMSVEGNSLVVAIPHASGEYAYPILLDPKAFLDEGFLGFGSSWVSGWTGSTAYNFGGSSLSVTAKGNTSYAAETHGQWVYTAPGTSGYVMAATFYSPHLTFGSSKCKEEAPKNQPHGYVEIWNPSPTPNGTPYGLETYAGNGKLSESAHETGWVGGVGVRNAVVGLGTSPELGAKHTCAIEFSVSGATIQENDGESPSVSVSGAPPSSWISAATASSSSINVKATDQGFGVSSISVSDGNGTTTSGSGCSGLASSRCPSERNWSIVPPYFQGVQELKVVAEDPLEKTSSPWTQTTRVDPEAPLIDLGGQLAYATEEEGVEGEENAASENQLRLPYYGLGIDVTDGSNGEAKTKQSGVKKVELFLDKELQEEWKPSPQCSEDSKALHETYPLKLTGLSEGIHHLKIIATDCTNQTRPREIDFEYIPATGEDSDFVLQRFPLSEAEEGEAEAGGGPELAVNVMNGNLVYHERDVDLNTPSTEVEVERVYNSELPEEESSEWGTGWTLAQTPTLDPEEPTSGEKEEEKPPTRAIHRTSGLITREVALPTLIGGEHFDARLHSTVRKRANGTFSTTDESGQATSYDSHGMPTRVTTGEFSSIEYDYKSGDLSEIAVADPAATTTLPEEVAEREGGKTEGQPAFESSFGGRGLAGGQLLGPGGMALDASGNLWVADIGNDRIQEFDSDGEYVRQFGERGSTDGKLREPVAVAIDSSGNIWVADAGNRRVQEFSKEGAFIRKFGAEGTGEGQFSGAGPQGIAIDGSGNVLVADAGGHRIEKFSSSGGFIEAFGTAQLSEPRGIAVGTGGTIWVADAGQDKVVALKSSGLLLREFGKEGEGEGELKGPTAVALDGEGEVFVADHGNGRVQEFSEAGVFLHEFGSREGIKGRFRAPMGVAANGEGDIWVAGVGNPPESVSGEEDEAAEEPPVEEAPGLVAAYNFDEGTGSTAHDDTGNGHDGTVEGATWSGSGKHGSALDFGGEE